MKTVMTSLMIVSLALMVAACGAPGTEGDDEGPPVPGDFVHVGVFELHWDVQETACRHNLVLPQYLKVTQYAAGYPGGIEGQLSLKFSFDGIIHSTFAFESGHHGDTIHVDAFALHGNPGSDDVDNMPAFDIVFVDGQPQALIDYARRDSEDNFEWGCKTTYLLTGAVAVAQ